MKKLIDYLNEVENNYTPEVIIESDSSKARSALYALRREAEGKDLIENFSYTGKRGNENAYASFTVKDRVKFLSMVPMELKDKIR